MLVMLWGSRYALAVVSAGYGGLVAVLAVGSPSAYVVGSLLALAEQERLYFTYRCADRPPPRYVQHSSCNANLSRQRRTTGNAT
jgi:hypothetical protein